MKTELIVILMAVLLLLAPSAEGWGRRRRRWMASSGSHTKTDYAPRFMRCSGSISVTTEEDDGLKRVDYPTLTAKDDRLGLTVSRVSGLPSGSRFTEGVHSIIYEATDSAGQKAYCYIHIDVTAVSSPELTDKGVCLEVLNEDQSLNTTGNRQRYPCPVGYFDALQMVADTYQDKTRFIVDGLHDASLVK